jgi:hypothetical protein
MRTGVFVPQENQSRIKQEIGRNDAAMEIEFSSTTNLDRTDLRLLTHPAFSNTRWETYSCRRQVTQRMLVRTKRQKRKEATRETKPKHLWWLEKRSETNEMLRLLRWLESGQSLRFRHELTSIIISASICRCKNTVRSINGLQSVIHSDAIDKYHPLISSLILLCFYILRNWVSSTESEVSSTPNVVENWTSQKV